jgi:hypothetical protein
MQAALGFEPSNFGSVVNCATPNGRGSAVNTTLDGSTYPGEKLVPSSLKMMLRNETTYTWDW